MIDAIGNRSMTYGEVLTRAASGALALRRHGLKPGDRVESFCRTASSSRRFILRV